MNSFIRLWVVLQTFLLCYGFFVSKSRDLLNHFDSSVMTYGAAVTDVTGDGHYDVIVAAYNGANLILSYNNKSRTLENLAVIGSPYEGLMDPEGRAVGVAACDIDGDGREEIYILNSNSDINTQKSHGDKLFKNVDNRFVDLLSDSVNEWIQEVTYAGQSVTCIDRKGTGLYGFAVVTSLANGTERFMLLEMDKLNPKNNITSGPIVLKDFAKEAGLHIAIGGRGIGVGPILGTDGRSDIFVNVDGGQNKSGENKLFMNIGGGKFRNIARELGIADGYNTGRDVGLSDINGDGLVDILAGNWLGHHRLYIQHITTNSKNVKFIDMATREMKASSALCCLAIADFDNDGRSEIFYNNVLYHKPGPNKLFTVNVTETDTGKHNINISKIHVGEALERRAYSTGSVVTDLDRDGVLDLLITHGDIDSNSITVYSTQHKKRTKMKLRKTLVKNSTRRNFDNQSFDLPRSKQNSTLESRQTFWKNPTQQIFPDKSLVFSRNSHNSTINSRQKLRKPKNKKTFRNRSIRFQKNENFWVRIIPKTRFSAPARGSKVTLVLAGGRVLTHVVSGGSGYRGQNEPVAHFGIGRKTDVLLLEVQWPDGRIYQRELGVEDVNKVHVVPWSSLYEKKSILFMNKHVDKTLLRRTGSAKRHNVTFRFVLFVYICLINFN